MYITVISLKKITYICLTLQVVAKKQHTISDIFINFHIYNIYI